MTDIEILSKLISSLLIGVAIGCLYASQRATDRNGEDIARIKELDSRRNS